MKAAYNFQRYQDQFIFMERKNIERLFVNFYKHKLPKHHIQRDVLSMTAIISKIFITWDDYQQFMDDHPEDFCLALKGVTPNFKSTLFVGSRAFKRNYLKMSISF